MPEYVYALHTFVPEHEDEIAFEAGQPIEIIERDEQYNDGWWQGRNLAGKTGLFPQSYTTPAVPTQGGVSASSSASSSAPITTPPDSLSPLSEELESASLQDEDTESRIGIAIGEPDNASGEVMKATMTDVQKALEQLGRNDRDGAQSFSFSSTRDGDTDRETDGTETDGEIGEGWHRSARDKLAEQARRVVEAQAAVEAREGLVRTSAPPIDVEMSDESEVEEDDSAFQHLQHMHFTRDHPHIPEEEEEEEVRRHSAAKDHRRKGSNETSSAILPKDDLPSPLDTGERTAKPSQVTFIPSSPPRSTRSPSTRSAGPNDRRSPSLRMRSPPTTPDAINIISPIPIVPMGVHIISVNSSPEPAARAASVSSVSRDIPAALPSPALTSSGTRQHSRQPSQQTSASSGGKSSTFAQSGPENEMHKKSTPSEWTVDDVVEWLKSKGFGSDVYDKFIEQEITGDVLLELDINLLKVEIGIVAFGKRVRIANAIAELRRPSSILLSDHQSQRVQSMGHSVPHSFGYAANSPSGSTQPSLHSPMFANMGSTLNGPPSSSLTGHGSLESPRGDAFATPLLAKRVSSLSSAGASVNGGGSAEGQSMAAGIEKAGFLGVAGLGLNTLQEAHSVPSPSRSSLTAPAVKLDETVDEDRGVQSEGEPAPSPTKQHFSRLFGRSSSSSGSGKDKSRPETPEAKAPSSPIGTISPSIRRRDSQDDTSRQARTKRSGDLNKGSERHSLFGGAFPTSIGRSRKPPPRVTSTLFEDSGSSEKMSLSLSRLYGNRKSSSTRPGTSEGSALGSLRNGLRYVSEGDFRKGDVERAKSMEKMREQDKATPKMKPADLKEAESTRKQTVTPQDGRGSRGPNALKPGRSIIEQIGHPDHQGWMRKKGDHYNSWKLRYFIIKGPHLYILRSNSKSETKIKGYVNIVGYKVVADENIDPGRYGFRIVHETDKTHFFSSEEQAVVREWMKAIMKATIGRDYSKPVVSSVNIPTIPLTVAQAMNPAPRPPSPSARAATQKALRRENLNQLSVRDERILMGLPPSEHNARIDDGQDGDVKGAPPRPSREARRASASAQDVINAADGNLVEWANSHLPRSLQVIDPAGPLFGGLALLRLAEDMMGKSASPSIPDSAFPSGTNDDKLDGLFRLFDFLLDNDVKMGSVSINDVRQGKRDKVVQLLKALKTWEDRRKEIVKSLGQGVMSTGPLMGPVLGHSWK